MSLQHRVTGIILFLPATVIILMTGCIKYSIPIPPPPAVSTPPPSSTPSNGTLSVFLADSAWTASYYTAYYYQSQQLFKVRGVAPGMNGDSTFFVFYFYAPFQLNQPISTNRADVSYYDLQGKIDWDAGNNSGYAVSYMNITAFDSAHHTIAGNIYGTLDNSMPGGDYNQTITVKNGAFNLNYTLQP
jgi:hypothetical protein